MVQFKTEQKCSGAACFVALSFSPIPIVRIHLPLLQISLVPAHIAIYTNRILKAFWTVFPVRFVIFLGSWSIKCLNCWIVLCLSIIVLRSKNTVIKISRFLFSWISLRWRNSFRSYFTASWRRCSLWSYWIICWGWSKGSSCSFCTTWWRRRASCCTRCFCCTCIQNVPFDTNKNTIWDKDIIFSITSY